jgi:carbonic anhydrase
LNDWIRLAEPVRELIDSKYGHLKSAEERMRAAEEENVLFSIERLRTYDGVQRRLAEGTLRLHAWFFKIASGELFVYQPEQKQFESIAQ